MGAVLGKSGKASDQLMFKQTLLEVRSGQCRCLGEEHSRQREAPGRGVLVVFEEKHGDGVVWLCKGSGKG